MRSPVANARTYRFDNCELDLGAHELRRDGKPIALERRPFQLLEMLVSRRGLVVTREEIIGGLWPPGIVIDFDTGLNTLVRKVRAALGDSPDAPAFIVTVPGVGYRFIAEIADDDPSPPLQQSRPRRLSTVAWSLPLAAAVAVLAWFLVSRSDPGVSILVLPFENLTSDEDLGYLAAGLAEDTNASLAQADPKNLRLVGRATASEVARSGKSAAEIGRDLGVDFVVESSLRAERPKLRVTSRLVRVADNSQVWSANFDRELTSTLGLQREISIAIAEQVRLRLSPGMNEAVARRQTRDPEAYDLYLRGRYAWSRISPLGNREALSYFQQAIDRDPGYALAWAGVLHVLSTAPITGEVDPATVAARAAEAAVQAQKSGAQLPEVQVALGYYHFVLDWDWPAAERALRSAVASDPNSAIANLMLGHVLTQQGNYAEGREFARRARELDPFFSHTFALSSTMAYEAGDYEAGAEFGRQAVAINPEGWVGYLNLAQSLAELGQTDAALSAYDQAVRYSGGNAKSVAYRAHLLARIGRRGEARAALDGLNAAAQVRYIPPYAVAMVHAGLEERSESIAWLERGLRARDAHLVFLPVDPRWNAYRGDAEFQRLIERCRFDGNDVRAGR
jgi:TolB-like protein/DNA-binding winged helix-turn-helix (wHTH) protein/Tfp pilus assembly protein PilF